MPRRPATINSAPARPVYPFAAIVGQEEMKLALLLNVIEPAVGGVLIMGHRGTGKSTAVRALADLLPPAASVRGCLYGCDPQNASNLCADCCELLQKEGRLPRSRERVPVVELPLGATEDRVCGTINIERALKEGVRAFEPGLLARANRGFLYIDEVNLLEDHLVDLLLDAATTGLNKVEREGVSVEHPARFVLVGSGNPEEGELRPQLVDRFGLCAEVQTPNGLDERVAVVERRESFERDPSRFVEEYAGEQGRLRNRLVRARKNVKAVEVPRALVRQVAELCLRLRVDGHRGELTIARAARALAAFEGRREASAADVRRVAAMSLRHRLRHDPLEPSAGDARIAPSLEELFGPGDSSGGDDAIDDDRRRDDGHTRGTPDDGDTGGRAQKRTPRDDGAGATMRKTPEGQQASHDSEGERHAPRVESRLPDDAPNSETRQRDLKASSSSSARRRTESQPTAIATRGRYARAVAIRPESARVAFDATLRAVASSRREGEVNGGVRARVAAQDLRYKQFRRKQGTLFIFTVDASGSMAANRIGQAKGALAHLLRQSYVNRDSVALVTFRERGASVAVPPSNAPSRARTALDALPVGGPTPLAAGLLRSLEIARRAARRGTRRVVLLLFTDGRANVPLQADVNGDRAGLRRRIKLEIERLGAALQRAGVVSTVVDTRQRFTSGGEGEALAAALGGRLVRLPLNASNMVLAEASLAR